MASQAGIASVLVHSANRWVQIGGGVWHRRQALLVCLCTQQTVGFRLAVVYGHRRLALLVCLWTQQIAGFRLAVVYRHRRLALLVCLWTQQTVGFRLAVVYRHRRLALLVCLWTQQIAGFRLAEAKVEQARQELFRCWNVRGVLLSSANKQAQFWRCYWLKKNCL